MGKKKVYRVPANQKIENIRKHLATSEYLNSSQRAEFNSQLENVSKITDKQIQRQRIDTIFSDIEDVKCKIVFGRPREEVQIELSLYGYVREKKGRVVKSLPPKKEEAPAFVIEEPDF